ncbi:hypothetical protein [Glycomyces algeriensis]|uniref:Uncharacterized protein n=1 Tax=Glycomyces algeriensis TaxID=256037 RepID=A0A9W6G605_9ACTN|nr:hypothetical protein [Glycomyces algeriensis]MDA1368398.1 hypothetical protein [Glycomyces algeriensis]MDR7353204.1 hypothetical protein [Glycomyces algeriensis]GLI40898.1 hypothetical protein GALLR39Z86_07480 [Glycomyces algeriensis]
MHDNFPMRASTNVHLNEGMGLEPSVQSSGTGVMTVGTWREDGWFLNLFGSPASLRELAEALHQLADETERNVNRQRTLDNAPAKSRTKFVLEGEATTEIKLAA